VLLEFYIPFILSPRFHIRRFDGPVSYTSPLFLRPPLATFLSPVFVPNNFLPSVFMSAPGLPPMLILIELAIPDCLPLFFRRGLRSSSGTTVRGPSSSFPSLNRSTWSLYSPFFFFFMLQKDTPTFLSAARTNG